MNMELNSRTIAASEKWRHFFNRGDAKGCASMYEENAKMVAEPFGTYNGRQEIEAFWRSIIDQGFTDVAYIDPAIEQVDESATVLTSGWKMNKAQGVITRELWVVQDDGSMRLREDHFAAQS